uniref:DNA primase n=1 Tax=Scleropages formosus TaxID=113540 RepID=A0A8C9TZB1_SCLFO
MAPVAEYEAACLPELLPLYYRRLFPFSQYHRWLSYGGVTKNYFQNREFSFTLKDDIYVRYQSFSNQNELEKEIQKMNPYKIDIGAVYSHRPNQHNTVKSGTFQALEKELVFDIDMTDYDDVRRCCSSADICTKCWILMTIAIRIIDRALREDFGFRHLLWVYSGRRGVHCWVCDEAARKLSVAARSAVAEYLTLVKGGEETVKKVQLSDPVHPFIKESLAVVRRYFTDYALVGQDIMGSKESMDKVVALVPDDILAALQAEKNPTKRWEKLKVIVQQKQASSKKSYYTEEEIMLQYCYPRLDVNVSKGVNHLLKSPFSVHPKTGRISVPIDLRELGQFNPFDVPTIRSVFGIFSDYKRTSLAKYVKLFDQFVEEMERSRKGELLRRTDLQKDF